MLYILMGPVKKKRLPLPTLGAAFAAEPLHTDPLTFLYARATTLGAQVKELKEELVKLTSEAGKVPELTRQLGELHQEIKRLNGVSKFLAERDLEVASLHDEVDEEAATRAAAEQRVAALGSELLVLYGSYGEILAELGLKIRAIEKLEQDLGEARQEAATNARAADQVVQLDTQVSTLTSELDTIRGELRTHLETIDELRRVNSELREIDGTLRSTLSEVRGLLAEKTIANRTLDERNRTLQRDLQLVEQSAQRIRAELDAFKEAVAIEPTNPLVLTTSTEPTFSGWSFGVDFGTTRQEIYPIYGGVVIGRGLISNDVEIITKPDELTSYFAAIRDQYGSEVRGALTHLELIERRTRAVILFNEKHLLLSRLHAFIDVEPINSIAAAVSGLQFTGLSIYPIGVNPIALENKNPAAILTSAAGTLLSRFLSAVGMGNEEEVSQSAPTMTLLNPSDQPFIRRTPLIEGSIMYINPETPISIKLYKPSLEIHRLFVACDANDMQSDHFASEITDVKKQLARYARSGTEHELIGKGATKEAFLTQLTSYQSLPEDATVVIVLTMHGRQNTLSFIDGTLNKSAIYNELKKTPSKKVLILNACHAAGFWDDPRNIPPRTEIVASSQADQTTYGGYFLSKVAIALATGADLKQLDGVCVYRRNGKDSDQHAFTEGRTVALPPLRE